MSLDESRNSAKQKLQQQLANNRQVLAALEDYLKERQQKSWEKCSVTQSDMELRQEQGEARAYRILLRDLSADAKVAP